MRDDLDAALAERAVRAGLLFVPMRVEQRTDGLAGKRLLDGREQRVGPRRVAAVDEDHAVVAVGGEHGAVRAEDRTHARR